jgi:polyhydroxyalkanoate synthesis regulator protein
VPSYLEFSIENLAREQQKLREQMSQAFGPTAFHVVEDQVRSNMAFFTQAMGMFSPFIAAQQAKANGVSHDDKPKESREEVSGELDALKTQVADMQARLEALARKGS